MRVIVTGANGMLGRSLVRLLAAREADEVTVLVRTDALRGFRRFLGGEELTERVRIIEGELATGGAPAAEFGDADHVFHLAGRSDWGLTPQGMAAAAGLDCQLAGVAADLAVACGARRLHAPSLIWAGDAAPPVVAVKRAEEQYLLGCGAPVRIHRLPVLAGRADTGEADAHGALNGLHALVRLLAAQLPASATLELPIDGQLQVLPVDVAAAALLALADADLVEPVVTVANPAPVPLAEVLNVLSAAAGGPRFSARVPAADVDAEAQQALLADALLRGLLARAGCPPVLLEWLRQPVTPADPRVSALLEQAGVRIPAWPDYGGRGYRYWQYALDRG